MSEENTVKPTSLDHGLDQNIRVKQTPSEKFIKNSSGRKVALEPSPLTDTAAVENRSWTMGEIERTVASSVLPGSKIRLAQYGVNLSRRNDFRLKDLTRRLESQISQDHAKELATGTIAQRVRGFDVQSQSMRLITANASLGSYQFQKTQVLPYMRKSLALSYEKTSLLKRIVGGVDSLEKAIVSKLEAIKLNTAAATPENSSIFQQIKSAVYAKKIDRVASNVSNFVMDGYDAKYKKHVSPLFAKLNGTLADTSDTGGVNGVSRNVTNKLNSIRRSAKALAAKDPSSLNTFERMQQSAARVTSGVLGGVVRLGQKARLSSPLNQKATDFITPLAAAGAKFSPFGLPNNGGGGLGGAANPFLDPLDLQPDSPLHELIQITKGWRADAQKQQTRLLEHITAIRQRVSPFKKLTSRKDGTLKVTPLALTGASPGQQLGLRDTKKKEDPQANVFKKLFNGLGSKLDGIKTTLQSGDKARAKFERDQVKRQTLLEKASAKLKIRKGSYEELLLQRKENTGKESKASTSGKMTGGIVGATGGILSSLFGNKEDESEGGILDTLKDKASEKIEEATDSAMEKAKDKTKRGYRRLSAKRRLRRMRSSRATGSRSITGRTGRGGKTLGKKLLSGLLQGGKGTAKIGAKGAWGVGKLGGKGLLALGKSSIGKGLGVGLAAGVAQHLFDKSGATGGVKRTGDTLLQMTQYGGMGAMVAGPWGAALGAAFGAIVANSDRASEQLGALGNRVSAAGSALWTGLFGQKAILKSDGTVVQQEKSSILEDIKIAFVGRKARYSSNGEVITTERSNLVGGIKYGFQKLLFGDKFSNGEYKEGTSIVDMVRDGIKSTLVSFGREMAALPGNIQTSFTSAVINAAKWAENSKDKINKGIRSGAKSIIQSGRDARIAVNRFDVKVQNTARNFGDNTVNFFKTMTPKKAAVGFEGAVRYGSMLSSPTAFIVGVSNAIYGWGLDKNQFDSSSSPYYAFATESLSAYGVKDRNLYKFIHSLETSQEKINKGEAKPFDDNDMAYMAGRFGLDSKNKDTVNYFKMWYKMRFLPAMEIISKVIKSHNLTFGSFLSADAKEIKIVTEDLKKALSSSTIKSVGLEPSALAYAKYAKLASADPGGAISSKVAAAKPFDPRAPGNRGQTEEEKRHLNGGSQYDNPNGTDVTEYNAPKATRKNAAMNKGGVKDQPEFKSAYQKLPANLKRIVDSKKALQFTLWSTSVQHGPDIASQIFQRDYSEGMDERSYVRAIYEDRATRFGNLTGNDRTEAVGHLGKEERFIEDLWGGRVKDNDMSAMGNQINNVIDPNSYSVAPKAWKKKGVVPITPQVRSTLQWAADRLGLSPVELAGLASYESVGSFNPSKTGGTGNRYQGIFQFGPAERRQYGVDNTSTTEDQIKALVKFAKDRGYRPGMGWQKLYTTINAGNPRASVRASDGNGTQLDHYRNIQKNHFAHAAKWLEGGTSGNTPALGARTEVASRSSSKPTPEASSPQTRQTSPSPRAAPQQLAAAKPTPKPRTPASTSNKPDVALWGDVLKANTLAMQENTKAVTNNPFLNKPHQTNILSPVVNGSRNNGGGFVTMQMKKTQVATG